MDTNVTPKIISPSVTEADVENHALACLGDLGWATATGSTLAAVGERAGESEVVLERRLRAAVDRINRHIPAAARDDAVRRVLRTESPSLIENNRVFHRFLIDGVPVEFPRDDGSIAGALVRLVDFDDPAANDWLAVRQLVVTEGSAEHRADLVLFVNGLPLAVFEFKHPTGEHATIATAYQQLQTYKLQIPSLFVYNEVLVISDGLNARMGSLTAEFERFARWRTVGGQELAPAIELEQNVLVAGAFDRARFIQLVRHFVVFEAQIDGTLQKRLAMYHQFHAVNRAISATIEAAAAGGDRRCGVVWHTQGSGKSLTMVFYSGCLVAAAALANPTIVVLTDRNDLDKQLFGTFSRCHEILRQTPIQAESRAELQNLLRAAAGGIIFTTIQKFLPTEPGAGYPMLSDRRNIVVIADEAHRSQYDFVDGFASHMRAALPNASFIGFTGTPIELTDRSTPAVFGNYISVYDIKQAVDDHATVPIYYEGRLARLHVRDELREVLDEEFEEVTEGAEADQRELLKREWTTLEKIVGAPERVDLIARDLVAHFEARLVALPGKAMAVGMSRRICVDLYDAIVRLRPDWHAQDDKTGRIKVVMTGSASDPTHWQPHIRSKSARDDLAERFKDPDDPLQIVIVRDMWLTGFDAPCLHTLYVDKPMRGHGLMQAIARVNRVFRDKPGGLVVDYLGLADQLRSALQTYTHSGGHGQPALDREQAIAKLLEFHDVCSSFFHGFDWSIWKDGTPADRLALLPAAQEHILAPADREDRKKRFIEAARKLYAFFALAAPAETALALRDDVAFFEAVRGALTKSATSNGRRVAGMEAAIDQLVSAAIASDGVVDIFAEAGLKKPDISILSDAFLQQVQHLPQKHVAVELLKKLLDQEIRLRGERNVVEAQSFQQLLEHALIRYQNRAIETAQVIEELIALAKDMRDAQSRGEELGLSSDEIAFYDALAQNEGAREILGDPTLRQLAQELVRTVRNSVTVDWTTRESVRAEIRVRVKRILKKHGYPPDAQERATETVLKQAELRAKEWAA